MSNAIPPVQPLNPQAETPAIPPGAKTPQAPPHPTIPQDTVTISSQTHQILAGNGKAGSGG